MTANDGQYQDQLNERVVALETLLTHLQRTVGELDQVVLAQQKRIETLERSIGALRAELSSLAGAAQQTSKPEDEKPPHY